MAPAKPALVGAFVLTGVALLVGALLLFGGTRLFAREIHAITYFPKSVAGLEVGAPVTFRGVRVGSVTRIGVNLDMRSLAGRIPSRSSWTHPWSLSTIKAARTLSSRSSA